MRHPDAVREATRDLGYGPVRFTGDDPDGDARDARAQADAARTELDRGRQLFAVATAERRRGDCDAAVAAAKRAVAVLVSATGRMMPEAARTEGLRFIPRARLVMGLCALEQGRAEEARSILKAPTAMFLSGVEGAERQLVIGIAEAELGDTGEALVRFQTVLNSGEAVTRALGPRLQAYALAAGISGAKPD